MLILGGLPDWCLVLMLTEANRRVKGPETFERCPYTLYRARGTGWFRGVSIARSRYFVGQCEVDL